MTDSISTNPMGKLQKTQSVALSSASTDHHSGHTNSGDRQSEEHKKDYTNVMFERWHKSNSGLPLADIEDIMNENPLFNKG
jgi:hypothetical protein